MIGLLDMELVSARAPAEISRLRRAVHETGFLLLDNTALNAARVEQVLKSYRRFFDLPETSKRAVDMARTGSNRGWGAARSERVNPDANPDYKQVFDCGYELAPGDPWRARGLAVYAPNQWPEDMPDFRRVIEAYFTDAMAVAMQLLRAISVVIGEGEGAFDHAFDAPMALLRGNYYPPRPADAGARDFGIAAHTDYGCLTLLATDGGPGLEVRMPDGRWQAVSAPPGRFIVNFGEMLEMWTGGRVVATRHRVIGGSSARLSVPLFFNPSYDCDVAPSGSDRNIRAGEYLTRRFTQTYLHLAGDTPAGG